MEIIASYYTDAGNTKQKNQDSLSVKIVNSPQGKIVFAVVCDGMGGLEQGELASREVVIAFNDWFHTCFAQMVADNTVLEDSIYNGWKERIDFINGKLGKYSQAQGVMLGTTLTALLIYQNRYYICHVGDSRIYKLDSNLQRVTVDHTLVEQEVQMGRITEDQAKIDPRRSVLVQCVGASLVIEPQLESGIISGDVTFLLCSDGFVHELSETEIFERFVPRALQKKEQVTNACKELTEIAMSRGERDNITAVGIVLK